MTAIDVNRLDETLKRIERAGELLRTIRTAGVELNELLDGHGIGIRLELEAGDLERGNGATAPVRPGPEDDGEAPAPRPSPPRPDSAAGDPPSPAAEPPAAAPAPQPSTPPPADPPASRDDPPPPPRQPTARDLALAYFRERAGEWLAIADVARGVQGGSLEALRQAIRNLGQAGILEHNGRATSASRYRFKNVDGPASPPGPSGAGAIREPAPGQATTEPEPPADERTPAAGPGSPPRVSRRVARELAREAQERETRFIDRDKTGTLPGRLTELLLAHPDGLRGIARRLGLEHPNEELVTTLAHMVRHVNADRNIGADSHTYEVAR